MKNKINLRTTHNFFNKSTNLNILSQEMSAEKRISVLRIIMTSLFLLHAIIEALVLDKAIVSYSLPFIITFIISLGFHFEIRYLIKNDNFRWLQRLYKYMVIFVDLLAFAYVTYYSFLIISESNPFGDRIGLAFILSLTFFVIIILFVDVFRFSSYTSYYIGFIGSVVVILFSSKFSSGSFFDISSFFEDFIFIGAIVLINLSAIISGLASKFFHSIIIKSWRQEQLERYLPSSVAKDILKGEKELEVGGKRKKVTILFSDIRNFTSMSENAEPEEVIDFLNSYFNDMIEVIFKYNGSLDKIIGDGIMAIYGLTEGSVNSEEMAVRSALDMVKKLKDFNYIRDVQGKEAIDIGIGIHTGEVIIGNVGTQKRMEFTAIGDAVNTAARLQDLTKKTTEKIVVSEAIIDAIPKTILNSPLGTAILKGKKDPFKIFGIK